MREIWGPAWFATALCVIVLVGIVFGRLDSVATAFFCSLPVVFLQISRTIQTLTRRVEELEGTNGGSEP